MIVDTKETFRTPLWLWQSLIKNYPFLIKGCVLDPSSGCGALIQEILKYNKNNHTICDIRKEELKHWNKIKLNKYINKNNMIIADFLNHKFTRKYNSIISNPPFTKALDFIEKSLTLLKSKGHVTFLQKLDF